MAIKELRPKLRLSFDEYAETWAALLLEFHSRGMAALEESALPTAGPQPASMAPPCHSERSEESPPPSPPEAGLLELSAELSAVLLTLSSRMLRNGGRGPEKLREQVAREAGERFLSAVYGEGELKAEAAALFEARQLIFGKILGKLESGGEGGQTALVGLARFLASRTGERPEEENTVLIGELGLLLTQAAGAFRRLSAGASPDVQLIGKPRFIVQQ